MAHYITVSEALFLAAKSVASANKLSVGNQIQYWAQVGRTCIENPDLPVNFIIDSLKSLKTKDNETELFIRV